MKKIVFFLLAILMFLCACAPKESKNEITATICVNVYSLLDNKELVPEEKLSLIPEDGVVMQKEITFNEGATVYDVAIKAFKSEKLHYEADSTKYFIGIGNIYAGDCGETSGWLYSVNEDSPSVGAAEYVLQDGDSVNFYYVTKF